MENKIMFNRFIDLLFITIIILSSSIVIFPEKSFPCDNLEEEKLTAKEEAIYDSMCPFGAVTIEYKDKDHSDEYPTCIDIDKNKKEWIVIDTKNIHDLINKKNMNIKYVPIEVVNVYNVDGELIYDPEGDEVILKEYKHR